MGLSARAKTKDLAWLAGLYILSTAVGCGRGNGGYAETQVPTATIEAELLAVEPASRRLVFEPTLMGQHSQPEQIIIENIGTESLEYRIAVVGDAYGQFDWHGSEPLGTHTLYPDEVDNWSIVFMALQIGEIQSKVVIEHTDPALHSPLTISLQAEGYLIEDSPTQSESEPDESETPGDASPGEETADGTDDETQDESQPPDLTASEAPTPDFSPTPVVGTITPWPTIDDDGDGYSSDEGDCDDENGYIHPQAPELCDGIDQDCDERIDEAPDADGDGVGPCEGDCDDGDPSTYPGAQDPYLDGVDSNCDGINDPDRYVLQTGQPPVSDKPNHLSISEAIEKAEEGEVIAVMPGSYAERLDFKGKNLRLIGFEGPAQTILKGEGKNSIIQFRGGEGNLSRLEGFTLRESTATAIRIEGSSPTLKDLRIEENSGYEGGGIFLNHGAPILDSIELSNNAAETGGGLYIKGGDPQIHRVFMHGNRASVGAGAYIEAVEIEAEHLWFTENRAQKEGGGLYALNAEFEGENIWFSGNHAEADGAGIYAESSEIELKNSRLEGNENHPKGKGGGIYATGGELEFQNILIVGNRANDGGGLYIHGASLDMENAVVASNHAEALGGGLAIDGGDTKITNGIFSLNLAAKGESIYAPEETGNARHQLTYSCFFTDDTEGTGVLGYPLDMTHNWVGDPLYLNDARDGSWMDDDYHLSDDSPLIDAGRYDLYDPDLTRSDIGAYGGAAAGNFDLDADGYWDWWNPKSGGADADADCDDRDGSIAHGESCPRP